MDGYFLDIIKWIHLSPKANTRETPAGVRNKEGCLAFSYYELATEDNRQCNWIRENNQSL